MTVTDQRQTIIMGPAMTLSIFTLLVFLLAVDHFELLQVSLALPFPLVALRAVAAILLGSAGLVGVLLSRAFHSTTDADRRRTLALLAVVLPNALAEGAAMVAFVGFFFGVQVVEAAAWIIFAGLLSLTFFLRRPRTP